MTKRILALLLCLALCLSLIPAAFAGEIEIADEPEELAEKTPEALPGEEIALEEPGEPGEEIALVEPGDPGEEIGVIDPEEIAPAADEPEKTTPSQDAPAKTAPGPDAEIQATVVASGSCGDDVTWTLYDNGELRLTGSGETEGYPGEFPGFYSYKDQCKTLVVGDGVTLLGTYLFYGMSSLSSATLGKDVSSINLSCFSGCSALTEIRFMGHAPTSIASTAFNNVTAKAYYYPLPDWTSDKRQNYGGTLTWTKDNKVGDDVTWHLNEGGYLYLEGEGPTWSFDTYEPGFYLFRDEIKTASVDFTISELGNYLFWQMDKITQVRFPYGDNYPYLTKIGEYAFYGCTSLTRIKIPASVTEIGNLAFEDCTALKKIDFRGLAPSIGWNAFKGVTATAYYPPVTDGGWTSSVMQNYEGALTWTLDNKVGDGVTWELTCSTGVLTLSGTGSTWNFTNEGVNYEGLFPYITTAVVGDGITRLGYCSFSMLWNLNSVSLPSTLTEIAQFAFHACYDLTELTIPASVTKIGFHAFYGLHIKDFYFQGHAPTFGEQAFDGVTATVHYYPVYSWTSDKMLQYNGTLTWVCDDKVGDDVTWYLDEDGTLTMTGTGATWDFSSEDPSFYNFRDEITSAVVGEGVTELGKWTFWDMDKLNKVSLPSTLTKVGNGAFEKCTSLSAITIPATVTEIGLVAFRACSSLKEIRFLGAAPTIGYNCFYMDTATAYYPADDASWTEAVRQQYEAIKLTWLPYTSMTLNGDAISATLPVHDSLSLVVKDSGGTIVTDASWSTSDPGVATVDENGVITAVKYGKCTITASTDGGINTAECALQTLFWDVADSSKYYFKHVYWAAEKGITKGYDLEYFDPQGTCTREQMMTFLWRLAGQPNPKTTSSPFPDVKSGAYYYKAVLWGVEKGITNGYSSGPYAGKFGVGLPCTREQAMTFLWRMAGKPNPKSLTNKFSDVKSSDYFFKAVLWAAENGIANGYADGTYGVGLDCLREHMVTFLSRYASKFM